LFAEYTPQAFSGLLLNNNEFIFMFMAFENISGTFMFLSTKLVEQLVGTYPLFNLGNGRRWSQIINNIKKIADSSYLLFILWYEFKRYKQ
jgi:hypothetical protein